LAIRLLAAHFSQDNTHYYNLGYLLALTSLFMSEQIKVKNYLIIAVDMVKPFQPHLNAPRVALK
jgi:hypothetical protein